MTEDELRAPANTCKLALKALAESEGVNAKNHRARTRRASRNGGANSGTCNRCPDRSKARAADRAELAADISCSQFATEWGGE